MDLLSLSCGILKLGAIAAIFVGIFANPLDTPGGRFFPRRWGLPAFAVFFVLTFALMASDRC